jgi:hypothetical protein
MPRPEDIEMMRTVRREVARRPIDTSLMTIYISHGIVYLRGQVRAMRGHELDLPEELKLMAKVMKQRPGIRDVVIEVTYRS